MRGQRVSGGDGAPRAGFTGRLRTDAAGCRRADARPQDSARHGGVAGGGHGSRSWRGRPGRCAARGLRVRHPRRDQGPPGLGADRRGIQENDRRGGKGPERSVRGSGRRGRRAPVPHQGLVPRAMDGIAWAESRPAAAGGTQAREDRDRRRPRGTGTQEYAVKAAYPSAASTARRAITVTRWARYSGVACKSLFKPSAFTLMSATDSGANCADSAFSMSAWRNTLGPAPVTATRAALPKSATKTPTIAKRDAGFLNFM